MTPEHLSLGGESPAELMWICCSDSEACDQTIAVPWEVSSLVLVPGGTSAGLSAIDDIPMEGLDFHAERRARLGLDPIVAAALPLLPWASVLPDFSSDVGWSFHPAGKTHGHDADSPFPSLSVMFSSGEPEGAGVPSQWDGPDDTRISFSEKIVSLLASSLGGRVIFSHRHTEGFVWWGDEYGPFCRRDPALRSKAEAFLISGAVSRASRGDCPKPRI